MSAPALFQAFTPSTTAVAGNVFATALVGVAPLILFFVLMGVFKVATHWCALISLTASVAIAVLAFRMPVGMALLAGTQGAAMASRRSSTSSSRPCGCTTSLRNRAAAPT